jgi:hypothetical protein
MPSLSIDLLQIMGLNPYFCQTQIDPSTGFLFRWDPSNLEDPKAFTIF